jgi:tripartite ATP-independent transporter DctM subunit
MDWPEALALMLGMVCALLALGLPVAFAFFVANIVGALIFLGGERGLVWLVRNAVASISNFNLAPIPLFLLMGEILLQTGLAFKAIDAIDRLIRRVPGRLAVVAVTGGTIFSALSGSTIATTAMLGHALLPNMLQRGYHPSMAMGPIMAIGGVDMLIPPSALTVLLGSLARIPIKELLIAGILPGLIMSVLFVGYIVVRCGMSPALAPLGDERRVSGRARWLPFLVHVVPLFLIFIVVIGSIFAGVASPTDSAALGCVATVLIALAHRALSWRVLLSCLKDMAKVTTMIFFIIAASSTYSHILGLSGATDGALAVLVKFEFAPIVAILLMVAILLVLGCFIDQVSMMLLTLPFFMPLAQQLQIDIIWLGVVFLISMQIGLLTPPFGLLLFVMKGVAPPHIKVQQVYAAAAPFVTLTLLVLALVIAVPWLSTALTKLID